MAWPFDVLLVEWVSKELVLVIAIVIITKDINQPAANIRPARLGLDIRQFSLKPRRALNQPMILVQWRYSRRESYYCV